MLYTYIDYMMFRVAYGDYADELLEMVVIDEIEYWKEK